jgi:polysaccharide export outer membrane protein
MTAMVAGASLSAQSAPGPVTASPPPDGYLLGADDVVTITVWNQRDISGPYVVQGDGTIAFPLVGRMKVEGLTLREVEKALSGKLAAGYFNNPQISATVEQYRSQQVYVVGEVRQPGTYPLTRSTTLMEVLSKAGSASAATEVLVVRPTTPQVSTGPVLPDQATAGEIIRVDLRELESAGLVPTLLLRDGDTIVVPPGLKVYVSGHVRNPGGYTVPKGTTLLQVVSIAGGVTDRGALGRTRVLRLVGGERKEVKLKADETVQSDDTITVPQKFF